MCGIVGFVEQPLTRRGSEQDRAALLGRMCHVIRHRGPDDQGFAITNGAALGMRRLSVIDLAGGHQPISNEDHSVTVVFNGEIYNYRELQQVLKARGHRFRTRSDTEVLVHAYEEYGVSCVNHFRGMFAFALWDTSARKLLIARDRVGKKPVYYTVTSDGTLVFGSELKSLLEYPRVRSEVDPEAIDAYLSFGYVPDPLSIFRGIRKLPAGHYLTFVDGQLAIHQYWDFRYEPLQGRSKEDYLEELRALLEEAVRIRLVADVPVGALLSGGIDSSTVVGLMSRASTHPIKTFAVGFHEGTFDELKYARRVAEYFHSDHHELIVTPNLCDIVDQLAWHLDEPFADSSAIPTYLVSKLARDHVKVVLSGDGGDELFAGHTRYVIDRRRRGFARVPCFVRRRVRQTLCPRLPHGTWGRNYLYNVALDPIDRYLDSVSVFTSLNKLSLYTNDFRKVLGIHGAAVERPREYLPPAQTGDPLDSLLYLDDKTYLPGDVLTKVDRMSMAASIEARSPLLDHKLIEFVTGIPASMKLRGFETKYIFKCAVRDLVPADIVDRPKQGFAMPMQQWINSQLRERVRETLTAPRTRQRGYLNPHYVDLLLDEHQRGRRDHSGKLWALLMLELWQRTFLDMKACATSQAA